MKKGQYILAAGLLSIGMMMQSIPVMAADGIIKSGNYHIDQFGEYDILADVEVKEDLISDVKVTGENFGGTYAETNKQKLSQASETVREGLIGISASDAEKIMEVDTASGATVSSNGIKRAVLNALDLEEISDATDSLEKTPEAGEYEVSIGVKSDVVEHSLVGNEKATANLSVGADGKMQLSYRMVSGTEKEPMYVLAFNGYYQDNDRTGTLTMEDASIETETQNGYTVVKDVSFPLCDLSGTYYVNSRIYVPAMSNLNGMVSGIQFENGAFDVDNIVTVYWDTLKKCQNSAEENMEITATVEEKIDVPTYSVVIPSAVSMGSISSVKDNVMAYEIAVRMGDKKGKVTVSAPEEGELTKKQETGRKKETLKFTNDFGKQTIEKNADQNETNSDESYLKGNIRIAASDVKKASSGTYSGTTVFTINYVQDSGKDPGKEPEKDPDQKPDQEPDQKPDSPTDLDVKNLADGVYSVTGHMVKIDKETASMSDNALNHTIQLTVKKGKYTITLKLHGLTIGDKLGYLSRLQYFTTGYTLDQYGNPKGTLAEATVDGYQKNSDGSLISDQYGTNYPSAVTFELIREALSDGYVPLQVYVPIMASISTDAGTQPVFLKLDWSTLKKTTADDPDFDRKDDNNNSNNNNNGSSIGNNSLGNNTLGGNSLGNSKLGSSSLGSKLSSGLKSASSVKTDDVLQNNIVWEALLLLGCVILLAGIQRRHKKKKANEN